MEIFLRFQPLKNMNRRASRIVYAEFRHRPPKQLQEMRINLLDFGDAA
jgi:hypothetical protein